MIKQSFLRNYSLSKIYCQAEDEKKKLKVFYIRKVNKILKQKQQKEREVQRQRKSLDNQQERRKQRQLQRELTKFKHSKSKQRFLKEGKKAKKLTQDGDENLSPKQKVDLRVTEVRFLENEDDNKEIQRSNLRLKTTLNKTFYTKRSNKKNTFSQSMYPLKRTESNLQVITKSINHSRHDSEVSCEETPKNKQNILLFQESQDEKETDKFFDNRKQQKMIGLCPLKMNCTFRRQHKTHVSQLSQSNPLGNNLHFLKIL